MNADDQYGPEYEVFTERGERGESGPFSMPIVTWGIDVSYVIEQFMGGIQAGRVPSSALDPDEVNKHLRRRA